MNISIPKLKAMIRFFATNTDPRLLGKKKLMKLFYFTDFMHVKNYASPITFDNYVNMEHGPVPSTILNLISNLELDLDNSPLADSVKVEVKEGTLIKRVTVISPFSEKDKQYFSPGEMKILESICKRFATKTGKEIEDASHKEYAWSSTRELQDIPYTLATGDSDCVVTKDEIELAMRIFS